MKNPEPNVVRGPLVASWSVTLTDSNGATQVGTWDRARSTASYFAREGRETVIVRHEHCPAFGCNGDGTRSVHRRGRMFATEVPCVGCRGDFETAETWRPLDGDGLPLATLLAALGYEERVIETYEGDSYPPRVRVEVTRAATRWPVHRGSRGGVRDWLAEIGEIL